MGPIDNEVNAVFIAFNGSFRARVGVVLGAIRGLLVDPNDTQHVFVGGVVVNRAAFPRLVTRLSTTPEGATLLAERPSIDSAHVDYDALRALPAGTLGGAYVRFLDANGLDPDLFHSPPGVPAELAFVPHRLRQSHDIWHVLAGYGPDIPSEVALQAFTYGVVGLPGSLMIVVGGTLRQAPRHPWLVREVWRAYRSGRRAHFLLAVRWELLWERPLDEVRAALGVTPRASCGASRPPSLTPACTA